MEDKKLKKRKHTENKGGKKEIQSFDEIEAILFNEELKDNIEEVLQFLDPQDTSRHLKKNRRNVIDTNESYKRRKIRSYFYESLTEEELDDITGYICKNTQEGRLINLFNVLSREKKITITNRILDVTFNINLSSYKKEVVNMRKKIARGHIRSAKSLDDAIHAVYGGNVLNAVMYLNQNREKIEDFIDHFEDKSDINLILKEILKWVPKGDYSLSE